ncbi:MAG: hydroxyacylglutathione hydrolase [Gammaproteobacteria bacterium]|nr:hydroxyacylglutathione hydrolase [Gammaproteobacteria bacterium]
MLTVRPIPAFDDNYIWLLQSPGSSMVYVVDPGDEAPVLELLRQEGLELEGILITHKHGDHTGGVADLLGVWPQAQVYGPSNEPVATVTQQVSGGDRIQLPGLQAEFKVMDVPGHTEGHVAYFGEGVLFCGDTLFAAGCGRVFSGTHEQLHHSLQSIAALPPETMLYCAHEYTMANLGFAKWVEPESEPLLARYRQASELRRRGESTVPSLLQLELDTNPFLRSAEPVVIEAAERYAGRKLTSAAEVFTAIRNWKDREYD